MRRRKILLISVGSIGLLIATALVVLFVMHSGSTEVGDGVGKTAEEVTTTSTADMPVILRPNVSRPSEAIQQELAHVDPSVDGWDTETFSEQATQQLKLLAKALSTLLGSDKSSFVASLNGLVHEDFSCGSLRPVSLKNVFKDRQLSVSRWEQTGRGQTDRVAYRRRGGFQQAAKSLLTLWGKAVNSDLRASFKIVRVEAREDAVSTTLQVQFAGPTSSGFAQQNAIWNCEWHRSSPNVEPLLIAIEVDEFEEIISMGERGPLLHDNTNAILSGNPTFREQFLHGIDYWRDRLDWRLGLDVVGPHGLAIGDVNGDGLDDLFVCEPGGLPNRLYVHNADGTATDISAAAGIGWLEPAASALLVDMDNDGDQDLLFTSGRFFISCQNNGDATFQLKTVLTMSGIARSMTAADYNLDGRLDIYVCCHFHREIAIDGVGLGVPMPYHDANNGPPNILFANLGGWQYKDVTSEVGLDRNNRRFSFAAAWEDYDNDGDPDLYVANDFGRNNLYRNEGGTFVDVAATADVEDVASGMSVSWGDYNRDGHVDLYVGNMFSSAGNRVMYQRRFRSKTDEATMHLYRRLARGNSLFENNGDGTFRDVSLEAGVNMGRWAWGSLFADLNNDGWDDLLVGNGMVTSEEDPGDL